MTHRSLNRRTLVTAAAALVTGGSMASRFVTAQTPGASPEASPAANFPEGPLGVAMQWLEDSLNTPGGPSVESVTGAVSPRAFETTSAADIASLITGFAESGGPWTIDTSTMIMTMDFPPSNGSFFVNEPGGQVLRGGISIERESGLIGSISLEAADTNGTPEASPET